MAFEVPLTIDFDDYSFAIDLDGTTYQLTLRWNGRAEKWFISLELQDGTEVIGMRPVIADWPPFARFRGPNIPLGELLFVDTSRSNTDPGRNDLGERVILVYLEEADIAV